MNTPTPYLDFARKLFLKDRARFLEKVEVVEGGCWKWLGNVCKSRGGYGRLSWLGRVTGAHRVSYALWKGEIPKGLHIDHLCRNPLCVNPDHLEPVTNLENYRRGIARNGGNHQSLQTHCKYGHEFNEENTYRHKGGRQCRTCMRRRYDECMFKKRGGPPKPLGWANRVKTHCKRGHEYTEENTWRDKAGRRWCRDCKRLRRATGKT